jgi:DNA-binding NarL/FixJ family response regulator
MPTIDTRIRVLVVERHGAVRHGVRDLLACYADIHVVAEARDGRGALRAAARQVPDVIVLDWHLPNLAAALAPRLRRAAPSAHILLLGTVEDEPWDECREPAVHGFLAKIAVERLAEAVRAVHRGEYYR